MFFVFSVWWRFGRYASVAPAPISQFKSRISCIIPNVLRVRLTFFFTKFNGPSTRAFYGIKPRLPLTKQSLQLPNRALLSKQFKHQYLLNPPPILHPHSIVRLTFSTRSFIAKISCSYGYTHVILVNFCFCFVFV